MRVSQWAEIRRLHEVERLSQRQIAQQLHCCWRTVKKSLAMPQPPDETRRLQRGSLLDPYKAKIDALIVKYPQLSAVRVLEEIRKGADAYRRADLRAAQLSATDQADAATGLSGGVLCTGTGAASGLGQLRIRPYRQHPASRLGVRRGAVLQSPLLHRVLPVAAQGRVLSVPRACAAVLWRQRTSGDRRQPEGRGPERCGEKRLFSSGLFALCGHFCLQPIACERADPESKGVVEAKVRHVKKNALQGRDEELTCWEGYERLAIYWRDQVANVHLHDTTKERPVDRFRKEQSLLRPLPAAPFDTDELVSVIVNSHARVCFDGNRYSVPPQLAQNGAAAGQSP